MIVIAGKNKNLSKRYFSNVIDYAIFIMAMATYVFLLGEPDNAGGYTVTGLRAVFVPFLWVLYFPVCEAIIGQTVAKKAFDLHVVDFKGEPPNFVQAFQRRMLDPVELFFIGIPSLLTINHSERNQRLGDMLAGTLVVSTEAACKFCGGALELNTREAVNNAFRCPTCDKINNENP